MRSFLRLIIDRELETDELAQFFDIVDEHVLTDTLTTFDDEGNSLNETSMALMVQNDDFLYEVATIEHPTSEESRIITEQFAKIISDDFEIATTFS